MACVSSGTPGAQSPTALGCYLQRVSPMLGPGLTHLGGAVGPQTGPHLPSPSSSPSLPPPAPALFSWTPQWPLPRGPCVACFSPQHQSDQCLPICSSSGFFPHKASSSIPLQGYKIGHQLAHGLPSTEGQPSLPSLPSLPLAHARAHCLVCLLFADLPLIL